MLLLSRKSESGSTVYFFSSKLTSYRINDVPYTIGLFDTASSEDYDRIRPLYYPQTDVFIIAASIDNISEYASAVHKWAPELQHHCPGIPMLLVGVKSPDKKGNAKGNFRLSDRKSLGKRIAKQIGAIGYFECDLTDLTGLKDVFDKVSRLSSHLREVLRGVHRLLSLHCNYRCRKKKRKGADGEPWPRVWGLLRRNESVVYTVARY
jgi:cell division control protein 42